jgi:acetyltransferase-like isoleucine patch superfamily enzyme
MIGSRTTLGWNNTIRNAEIGKFCSVAWNCTIGGAQHPLHRLTTSFFPFDKTYGIVNETELSEIEGAYSKPIIIGNDVWIAAGVQVLRGVNVGDGAVLGGGTIITKDVPPYEIWAGVPAKKIGQRFSDEIIAELMEIKWWDLPIDDIKDNIDLFRKDIDMDYISELKSRL